MLVAILALLGSAIVVVAQPLPVRFRHKRDASSQPTIIVGREPNAYDYTHPYSKYAALSPTLTRIKRELQLGEQQQQQQDQDQRPGAAAALAKEEMLEHLVSLGDLMAELGNGHVENVNDAQMRAAAQSTYGSTSTATAPADVAEDYERGVTAYQSTVELYERAMTFFGEGEEESSSQEPDNDIIGLLTGVSTIQLQLAELVMADPTIQLTQLLLDPDAERAAAAVSPEILSPFYEKALRHNRDAILSYERALQLLRGGGGTAARFDEEWSVQLELAYADASVRLGSQIVECYEQGLIGVVLDSSAGNEMNLHQGGEEDSHRSTVVSLDGTTSIIPAQAPESGERNDGADDSSFDDSLQIFGVDGERVLKMARERFEKAAAIYRRFEATATGTNGAESTYDDRVQLADVTAAIGLVSLYLGDLTNSISMYENSIEIYSALESEGHHHHFYDQDGGIPIIVADMLSQLSDVLLQTGRYDECIERYNHSMQKFTQAAAASGPQHKPPPPRINSQTPYESDDSLRLHEEALEDYYASLGASGADILDDFGHDGLDDPLYEADLLFNLGTIHLSQNDPDEALRHLTKAIALYEGNLEDESPLADALLNKASCLFYLGRYDESAATHEEAIEIYRSFLEEGGESEPVSSFGSNGPRSSRIRERLINLDEMVLGIRNSTQTVV
mmetsp:Transcript_25929/g.74978  ORF Transcript_25929/g.74978 Transcript_25929/m.74978 type:complete len:677 (+) Transcript_25929:26-2056(+)